MRQIKFRAWYNSDKEMSSWEEIRWRALSGLEGGCGYELMQFTGLKDKKGKEIYEGDVVKYCQKKAIIEWNTGAFHLETFGKGSGWGSMLSSVYQELEVIGNRFENPELLKEK